MTASGPRRWRPEVNAVRRALADYERAVADGASYQTLNQRHLAIHLSLVGLTDSPRKQRRFFYLSASVLAIGVAAFLSLVVFKGTSNAFTDTISNKPATLYHPDKKVPLSKEQVALARRFIQTAVERKNLDAAYSFTHPDLRGNLTRKQWDTGNIPVINYPARNAETASFVVD